MRYRSLTDIKIKIKNTTNIKNSNMKKLIFSFALLLAALGTFAQSGLQGIIVEKYYVSNAADSSVTAQPANGGGDLAVGSTTWRIFADLAQGYTLQAV